MSIPVAAVFAAAIYQARSAFAEPDELERTVALLAQATDSAPTSFELMGDDLRINGTPRSLEVPGIAIIRHALVDHYTARLILPAGLAAGQWRQVVELYASPPGLYGSVDDLRDALRHAVPDAVVSASSGSAAEADLRQSLFELPGLRRGLSASDPARASDLHDAELAELSAQLDPLLRAAERAGAIADYPQLAQVLLQVQDLATDRSSELRAIVLRERRRVVPTDMLDAMARAIPKPGTPGTVARALGALGHDGAAALFGALGAAHSPHERRAHVDALVACRDCDETILDMLGNERTELVRDAAEVVGRKRLVAAIPRLAHLLRHAKVDVRTTAWHALEEIGTPEALRALRR